MRNRRRFVASWKDEIRKSRAAGQGRAAATEPAAAPTGLPEGPRANATDPAAAAIEDAGCELEPPSCGGWAGDAPVLFSVPVRSFASSPSPKRRRTDGPGDSGSDGGQGSGDEDFLSLLIDDLDEIQEVPLFDVRLPWEVATRILSHCDYRE